MIGWFAVPTYHQPKGERCETSVKHGLPLWAGPDEGHCSRRQSPSPTWGSRSVGARELGPWVGEPKPPDNTPLHALGLSCCCRLRRVVFGVSVVPVVSSCVARERLASCSGVFAYGCGSRPAVGVLVDGPTMLQPVVGPGCGGGCPVARGGPCTVTGLLLAAVGPAKEVPICLPLPSCPLCMQNFTSCCTFFMLASSVSCPHAFAAYVQHCWSHWPPGRCPPCTRGKSRGTWCAWCCVPLGMFLPASGVPGLLLPHAVSCPPGVRARVPCSSGWVVSASLGPRALGYIGPVLLWSVALWSLWLPYLWFT